jgi:hypothetical protein
VDRRLNQATGPSRTAPYVPTDSAPFNIRCACDASFHVCRDFKIDGTISKARCDLLMDCTRKFYEQPQAADSAADVSEILGSHAARVSRASGREISHPHSPNRSRQAPSVHRDSARLPNHLRGTPGNHVPAVVHGNRGARDARHLPLSRGATTDYQSLRSSQASPPRRRNEARH